MEKRSRIDVMPVIVVGITESLESQFQYLTLYQESRRKYGMDKCPRVGSRGKTKAFC